MNEEKMEPNTEIPTDEEAAKEDVTAPEPPVQLDANPENSKMSDDSKGDLETGKVGDDDDQEEEEKPSKDSPPEVSDEKDSKAKVSSAGINSGKSTAPNDRHVSLHSGESENATSRSTPPASMPGAFAINNPLFDDPIVESLQQQQQQESQPSRSNDVTIPTAPVTLESQVSSTLTAEAMSITVAKPVESTALSDANSNDSSNNPAQDKRKIQIFIAVVVAIMVILVVVLAVPLAGPSNKNINNDASKEDLGSPIIDNDSLLMRREEMIELFSVLTDPEAFDPSHPMASPERIAALQWIVEEDSLKLPILDGNETSVEDANRRLLERYVLALFYFSTNGDQWTRDYNFLLPVDVCRWSTAWTEDGQFYNQDDNVQVEGIVCNDAGRVTRILNYWNNLGGTIPEELSFFSDTLTHLNIGGGSMAGTIPSFLTRFTTLTSLGLNDHCFTGSIPDGLADIPSMEYLFLYHNSNQLTGSLEAFCEGPSAYREGVGFVGMESPVNCSCCTFCVPDRFECTDLKINATWPSANVWSETAYDSNNNNIQFKKQCTSSAQREWIAEECPCISSISPDPDVFNGFQCDNCTAPDARPSYLN